MYLLSKQNSKIISLIIIAIGLFLLCSSCENGKIKKEKPSDLLEQKTFDSLLWELYLIEGDVRFRLRNENIDSLRIRITSEMNAAYEKHNTDHEQFLKSYAYYMKDNDLSEKTMKDIVNQLVELQAKEEVKQKEKDSLRIEAEKILPLLDSVKNK